MDLSDYELWENARRIYDGEVGIEDFVKGFYVENELENLENEFKSKFAESVKILKPMCEAEFVKIPIDICKSGNSIAGDTKDELVWFLGNYPDLTLPTRIPFKETLCIVMSKRPDYCPQGINDVIRYSIYMMGGDPSLPSIPKHIPENAWRRNKLVDNPEWRKLKTLPRSERKHIVSMIEEIVDKKGLDNTIPDAKSSRFYGSWVLVNERVHIGDYCKRYEKAATFFKTLLTPELNKKYKTWNSKVQEMYDTGKDIVDITQFISTRPGELVRRLDSLLRRGMKDNGREGEVFDVFLTCDGMNNKTLLELISYYDKVKHNAPRLIKVVGRTGFQQLPPKEKLDPGIIEVIQDVIHRKILINIDSRITEKDLEGKLVVLDPEIKRVPIPKDMRSAASYIPRGTEFPIPEDKNIVSFFVQWIQEEGKHEDLDLHGYLCNESGKGRNIGWNTGLKGENNMALHSGDVIGKPGKCQETIIFDIEKCLKNGYKYIVGDVCNYRGRGFDTLPCHFGYSFQDNVGEVTENTVTVNPDYLRVLDSKAHNIATIMVDLEKRTIMILDVEIDKVPTFTNGYYYENLVQYFTTPQTFTTYEIMEQYFKSRGAEVIPFTPTKEEDKEFVDEVWMVDDVVRDYVKVLSMIGE